MKNQSSLIPSLIIIGVLFLTTLIIINALGPDTAAVLRPAPGAPPGQIAVVGGDEASVRVALQRFLDLRSPIDGGRRTTLLIGQLPPDVSVDVPLPKGAQVVGSLVAVEPDSARIAIDSDEAPDAVFEIYAAALRGQGYREQDQPKFTTLRTDVGNAGGNASFCRKGDPLVVSLIVYPGSTAATSVDMYVLRDVQAGCPPGGTNDPGRIDARLPDLRHPPGAVAGNYGGEGGSGPDSASMSVGIKVDTTPRQLAEFYRPQLEAVG